MPHDRREMLLKEYAEVASTFRMLTDIRFKLLAFLPLAAGAAGAVVARTTPDAATLAFSVFGLVVTLGLITYNARNDQLYDTLVGRAAALERQLGDPDGAFANRPQPWLRLAACGLRWKVDHRTAIATIYYASLGLWLFGVIDAAAQIGYDLFVGEPARPWVPLVAVGMAVFVTSLGAAFARAEKSRTEADLRRRAREAVEVVTGQDPTTLADHSGVRDALAQLANQDTHVIEARLRYLSTLPAEDVSSLVGTQNIGTPNAAQTTAARTVAYIADLPPEWVYDCATSRRRDVVGEANRRKPGRPRKRRR